VQKLQFRMLEHCSEHDIVMVAYGLYYTYCRRPFVVRGKGRRPAFRQHQSMFDSHRDTPAEIPELVASAYKKERRR
jgi:hypothetical protein